MPKKKLSNHIDKEAFELRYTNSFAMAVDIIKPKNLLIAGGRGTSKTTDILAKRFQDVCIDIPRGSNVWIGNTYTNLTTNVIPALIQALEERHGWIEGIHFVVDERPPNHWRKPSARPLQYKHTISTVFGNFIFLKSLDKPSGNAGISVGHIFGDEAKYFNPQKLNKLTPTLRGDLGIYGHSHYFRGVTYTTDMPNLGAVGDKEYNWLKEWAKDMDLKQIEAIYQTAMHLNQLKIEYHFYLKEGKRGKRVDNLRKNIERWSTYLHRARKGSTVYHSISSLANVDILTLSYIQDQQKSLGSWEEFKTAILSFDVDIPEGSKFYPDLRDENIYLDSYNDFFSEKGLKEIVEIDSRALKYIRHDDFLEVGFDAGNMMSLVIGQPNEKEGIYRALKTIHTITPEWIDDLTRKLRHFFRHHGYKSIKLWGDRSTNQYAAAGKDLAGDFKKSMEFEKTPGGSLRPTGWTVEIMTRKQGNIEHVVDYEMAKYSLLGERNLLKLMIDGNECSTLINSMRVAKIKKNPKTDAIQKDKSSEKLPAHKLANHSTNMSDGLKYLICRIEYINRMTIYVRKISDPRTG